MAAASVSSTWRASVSTVLSAAFDTVRSDMVTFCVSCVRRGFLHCSGDSDEPF